MSVCEGWGGGGGAVSSVFLTGNQRSDQGVCFHQGEFAFSPNVKTGYPVVSFLVERGHQPVLTVLSPVKPDMWTRGYTTESEWVRPQPRCLHQTKLFQFVCVSCPAPAPASGVVEESGVVEG